MNMQPLNPISMQPNAPQFTPNLYPPMQNFDVQANQPPLTQLTQQQPLNAQQLQIPAGMNDNNVMKYQTAYMERPITAHMERPITAQMERPITARPQTAQTEPNVIVVNNNGPLPLGHEAQRLTCPHCHVTMLTRLDYHSTYRTHVFAFLLCITGLFCFAPLPYCLSTCKSLDHYCSNCDQFVGNLPNN